MLEPTCLEAFSSLQVSRWLASVALWAADRGLLEWVRWPPVRVHHPGAPLPPVLALAHCFVNPGSAGYATAFCNASRAKGADPIAVALKSVSAYERGDAAGAVVAAGRHGAAVAAGGPGGSTAEDIITCVEGIYSQLKVRFRGLSTSLKHRLSIVWASGLRSINLFSLDFL